MTRDNGRFVWFELLSHEVDQAQVRGFYAELFGWNIEDIDLPGGMSYTLIKVGDALIGGMLRPPVDKMPNHWLSYVSVEDVDATAKKVVACGGKALSSAFDVPGFGRVQTVQDPHGGVFGLWRGERGDVDALTGPGSFQWTELWTTDPTAEVKFYGDVLGYTHDTNPMPQGGEYHILKNDETWRGGIMAVPVPGVPPTWMTYVAVEDCGKAAALTEKLGGRVLSPPMTMQGVGEFAVITDPHGAALGLLQPAY